MRRLLPIAIAAVVVAVAVAGAPASGKTPKKPAVILLVFDEWPLDALLTAGGHVDAGRYPNIAAFAKTATWYPNATTVYDSTTKAVPEVLDGRNPRAHTLPTYRFHPHNIFTFLGAHGYTVHRQESATSLCPPRVCPGSPAKAPAILPLLRLDRRRPLEKFLDSITAKPGTLWVRHTLLPHGPYVYLPSGRRMRPGWEDPIPGMNGPPGFDSRALTEHNQQRLRLQMGLVDRELGRLFDRLKREGTFDDSLIAFLPDHGIASELHVADRRKVSRSNIDEIAPVPLFVKAPGQKDGKVDRSWIRTIDVVPTIADVLHMPLGYKADGRPASSPVTRRRKYVRMFARGLTGTFTVPARDMLRRRARLRRKEARLYGNGSWASLYRGGPDGGLVGRSPGFLLHAARGTARARVVNTSLMRDLPRGSGVVPAQVAGHIAHGDPGAHREIAVAVNHRIEAVTRTFSLRGSGQEQFAAMVPEQSLHPGHNVVQVFQVLPARAGAHAPLLGEPGLRLRPLGRD
jgi:Sulfatase